MSFFTVTKSQQELLDCTNRFTIVECEPGAGATHGLLLKAVYEAMKGSYVVVVGSMPNNPGGLTESLKKILKNTKHTFSAKSSIFQLKKGGKIKLVHYGYSCTAVGADWLLIDHRFTEVAQFQGVSQSSKHLVATCYPDDRICGTNRIRFYSEDNHFLHKLRPDYRERAFECIPEKFFKDQCSRNSIG